MPAACGHPSPKRRTVIPDSAFLAANQIDPGTGPPIAATTGDEVATEHEAGPNHVCGQGAAPGWVAWVSREFRSSDGRDIGYQRIVTYPTPAGAQAALAAAIAAQRSCPARQPNVSIQPITTTLLGPHSQVAAERYTVNGGVSAGVEAIDYVADFTAANVDCELVQRGQQQPGADPGPAAILTSASNARATLTRLYT